MEVSRGVRVTSDIDGSSGIAYYELYQADEFVSKGVLYRTSDENIYASILNNYNNNNTFYTIPTNKILNHKEIEVLKDKDDYSKGMGNKRVEGSCSYSC